MVAIGCPSLAAATFHFPAVVSEQRAFDVGVWYQAFVATSVA